jgi:D-glucuronyl C5-epimerase C-terminus
VGGSPVIWQYYPGQGIELQMLGNWSKANALFQGHDSTGLRDLVDALVPLAADRGGWPAWEYYFRFAGGAPPWTSAISQGTALQALARAGQRLRDTSLWDLGRRALEAFQTAPPQGVRDNTANGAFYLIYTYAPNQLVINAHLQAIIGLFDFAKITGDPTAQTLFQQGDAEARAVLPHYDTGHWSLYDQTTESDLNYHELVTGFLDNLCKRTSTPIYCDTAQRFNSYMQEPPGIALTTRQIRAGAPAKITFSLDKVSRVGIVISRGGRTFLSTSASFGHGSRFFTWSRPASAGTYDVKLTATDLKGNRGNAGAATLRILPARH